jgi:ribosome-associated toxin RatA of RatAB toxin-antitoxin module
VIFTVNRSALVGYSAQQMFDLVNDIESYPMYMEGCVNAQIIKYENESLVACLELKKAGISQKFTTRNIVTAPSQITMSLVEGPFKRLDGVWRFLSLSPSACKITFHLEFELENKLVGVAVGKLFESVANKQVDSICLRAAEIYQ